MQSAQTRVEKARAFLRHHGILRTIHRCSYSAIKHYYPYITMSCVWAGLQNLSLPAEASPYHGRFLEKSELLQFARDPVLSREGLTEKVIPALLDNGDECFGILDGDRLIAFCWYCVNSPARINDHWALEFNRGCVYVYFVYTHPEYRGKRLLAHGIKLATREYAQRGYRNILAFVEWANYSSLSAFFRMGFQEFGRMSVTKVFGKTLVTGGRGCERFGFRVVTNQKPLQARLAGRKSALAD